ncbi:MAG: sensor histidine kinase [Saprospiraceae bacterium]|nr:sensor histidine kinase [Bacteroidia bacterium]NNE15840.1 sensor histidine kinase [Saprospiraceae bacterium]NNL92905.1 sensor histidine kinase [Saprospiraceae bacterium]
MQLLLFIKLGIQNAYIYLGVVLVTMLIYVIYKLRSRIINQNQALVKANSEKEILISEIHHRVKNNLQIISSLLSLQSNYIQDNNAFDAIRQGHNRVHTISLIHNDLYAAENLKGVSSIEYFENILDNLFDSYNINEEKICLDLQIDALMLDVDTMIPLGLITNELVSNVFKHAFEEKNEGKIKVALTKAEDCLILEVSDNGKGLDNHDDLKRNSFGYALIQAFANKLKADIEVNSDSGLRIALKIKNFTIAA